MIQVNIFRNNNGLIRGFEISGHAGYAELGQDIVCAAVSILATTTVNSLLEQLSLKPSYKVDENSGFLECYISEELSEIEQERAQVILKTLEIGLKSIKQEYTEYIKIRQRRWT